MAEGKEVYKSEEKQVRYVIVRVENNCPYDVCGEEDFCFLSKGKTLADMCDYCDFLDEKIIIGDTKEQLEKKIITAIERAGIDYVQLSKEEIAKEIVEFLGVE